MNRRAPLAVLALTASTAAALPTDDGNTRPTSSTPTGAPEDFRRREITDVDAYARRNRGHERGGFAAFDAGLTLVSDDATSNQAATGLGFTVGAYISRALVFAGRGSATLDTGGTAGRPMLRDVGVSFGVDVRLWRPLWAGAGMGFAKHRFEDPGMATAGPTARLRLARVGQVSDARAAELPHFRLALFEQVARQVEADGRLFQRQALFHAPGRGLDQFRLLCAGAVVIVAAHVEQPALAHVGRRGIDALMAHETFLGAVRLGYTTAEVGWMPEDDKLLIRMVQAAGGKRIKTYRVFERPL